MRCFTFLLLLTAVPAIAPAQSPAELPTSASYNFFVNQTVPDGLLSGVSDSRTVVMPGGAAIVDLSVQLNLAGGFNGDYYAWLTHGSGFSVLLNRAGRTAANPIGYSDGGFDVTFGIQASPDIHSYRDFGTPVGSLLGLWSPDGRLDHPFSALDTSPRSAFLESFAGLDPNGQWTLFVADVNSTSQGTLVSWGLTITAIPEPASSALLILGAAGLAALRSRRGLRI